MTLPRSDVGPEASGEVRPDTGRDATVRRPSEAAESVVRTVVLDATPERVWEAVTEPALLSEWLAPDVELEPHEGGAVVCRHEDGGERRGEVELVEEAERLAFSWHREGLAPSRVELVLDAVADGTRLTVIETGLLTTGPECGRHKASMGGQKATTPTQIAGDWTATLARLPLALGRLVLA